MKRINYILWYFPFCFFVFLAIYIFIKFLFIFFFRAAYEPEFMFDLTPYYILSGVNNLHLLFLSLIAVIFDAYLHANVSKRYLLFSFFREFIIEVYPSSQFIHYLYAAFTGSLPVKFNMKRHSFFHFYTSFYHLIIRGVNFAEQ